tara:strand:+ start:2317 stop:2613 length:297 start_codon:yes stop_codon:yes gene_type:complete
MIKHIVLLKWKQNVSSEQIDRVTTGFQDLKNQISEIAHYSFGKDASIYRGNADYALVAEFISEEDLKIYVAHPKHQEFMREVTGPIMESFQSIQFVDR